MAKYKIIPSSRTIVQSPISIGHKAEKGVEAIEFDLTAWVETYGSGTLTVIMRRWGDAIPYPIALEIDENNKATWTLSDIDTAKAGMAYAQLSYIVGDEVVKKSDIYTFRVMDSLTGEGEPPEAYESWLEHLTHLAAEAMAEVLDIEGIVTDKTLTVDGGIADGKATGDALALKADKSTTYTKTEVDQMIEDVEVETDTTLEIAGAPADAAETGRQIGLLKADLADVYEEHIPVNYGEVSTENLVIGSSGLSGKVTATNTNNGVSLINTGGVNGTVGFRLANLPYGSNKALDFTVEISGAVTPINLDIRRGVSSGSVGVVVTSLTLTNGVYALNNWLIANYSHDTYGDLYLGYSLRYNQTSAVTISLAVIEHGDAEKKTIKNNALVDIGYNNLTAPLKNAITLVSGDSPTEYGGKQICTFNKGLAIGDSLTSGVFNYTGGSTTIPAFSFPAKMGQLTGIEMTNLGNGGKTSVDWYALHSSDDLSGYQFAIIQLGVNDAMQYNGWTQNSIDAFTSIINKLLTENNGIFIFVSTIIPATSYTGASYNAVSEGIRNLIATLNNNHVILLDMAQYAHTGDAVGYNNGHLSALGYERLALDYISYISYVISQNLTLFRNIQFIGTEHEYT